MKRIKQIALLIVLLVSLSSCAMRTAVQFQSVSDVSFNPFASSSLGFTLNIKNDLKKDITIESGSIAIGEDANIILHITDPICITPALERVPIKLRLELSGGANILSLIPLVKELKEMPIAFDGHIRLGNRKKTFRLKKKLSINVKELLSRLKL